MIKFRACNFYHTILKSWRSFSGRDERVVYLFLRLLLFVSIDVNLCGLFDYLICMTLILIWIPSAVSAFRCFSSRFIVSASFPNGNAYIIL